MVRKSFKQPKGGEHLMGEFCCLFVLLGIYQYGHDQDLSTAYGRNVLSVSSMRGGRTQRIHTAFVHLL